MRVIGGTSRGRRLAGLPRPGVRPTTSQVKEALFNILGERILKARFLDLFAGTGAVGIEALSRGARHVTFVESDPAACRRLRANLLRCGSDDRADIRQLPIARFLTHQSSDLAAQAYDIVFFDPPYHTDAGTKVLSALGGNAMIRPDGVVVIEHFHKTRLADRIGHLTFAKSYRYGDTVLSIYRPVIAGES
jgi:16S rRNA (guanine(966)-N(2))-methyltransferase RsmD